MPTPGENEKRPPDPIAEWMLEVSTTLTSLAARLQAVEKSVDQNTVAVTGASTAGSAAASALLRIARTEEERLTFDKEQTRLRQEQEKLDKASREAWLTRLWSSQPFQLLCFGLVFFVLQGLGVSYVITSVFSKLTPALSSHGESAPPTEGVLLP